VNRFDLGRISGWPDVPACYGWLSLDRRGQWRLRGGTVTHRGLRDFLNRGYGRDAEGHFFVQNGPQRVFVDLEYTPWVLHLTSAGTLETHTGHPIGAPRGAAVDEEGNLLLEIADGIALVCDRDLPALLGCLRHADDRVASEAALLAFIDGTPNATADSGALWFRRHGGRLPLRRLRRAELAARYGYIPAPRAPSPGERR
jgi:hypothetical protein